MNAMLCCDHILTKRNVTALFKLSKQFYCTPKKDGVRLRIQDGGDLQQAMAYSRSNTVIPNALIQMFVDSKLFPGAEGEITLDNSTFHETSGWVRTANPPPKKFTIHLFDFIHPRWTYLHRLQHLQKQYKVRPQNKLLWPEVITSPSALTDYYDKCIDAGDEGIIIRTDAPYKEGRATYAEGSFFRMVEWERREATIIGFIEAMENLNPSVVSKTGHSKRSKHATNMRRKGTLGALHVRDMRTGVEFEIGSGWDAEYAQHVWDNRADFIWQGIVYKCKKHGAKDKPRSPVWVSGFEIKTI